MDALAALERRGLTPARLLAHAGGLVLGLIALLLALPRVSGAPWRAVEIVLATVPAHSLVLLVGLWAAGLAAHTVTLTAALPGLTHRRALLLSLTGSAVANVFPLGGAAGVALNYRMTRRWGFSPGGFAGFTVVSNLWDVLAKLVLPMLLVPLVLIGLPVSRGWGELILVSSIACPTLALLVGVALVRPVAVRAFGGRVERSRRVALDVVRTGWRRLSAGMAAYTFMLFALLETCLSVTGAGVLWQVVLLAFCVERLATLVGLTPGGLGLVEVGLAGALALSPGADPAGTAAGVLLYRALTFGLEIPVGAVLLLAWTWRQRATT